MEIRPVRTGEGARLRQLRLQAVRDVPEAFFFPLDTEAKLTAADWERWAGAEDRVMFVAVEDGRWLGMAGCSLRPDGSATLDVTGMWVTPAARRRRLASNPQLTGIFLARAI